MSRMADTLKKIVFHTVAVYVAMLASIILTMLLILIIPGAGQVATPIGRLLEPPFWLPQLASGAAAGWLIRRRLSITNGGYGVVLPAVLLAANILTEGLRMRASTPLVDIYFSANSGDTEGLYKLFFTAPLYTAIAYGLGALASKLMKKATHNVSKRPDLPS